jgi:bifunctional oligoribonuclease and PAP phosphatase NrnA
MKQKHLYKTILNKIKKYPKIVVFRHQIPDFDALGTQWGLATWLKDNFPKKTIHVVGKDQGFFRDDLYPKMDHVSDDFFDEKTLAIVVDTANTARIDDERYSRAAEIIKIDHHPNLEPYGQTVLVDTSTCAASELIMVVINSFGKRFRLSKQAAIYFFSGIAGDSGRFMYSSTSPQTFAIAKRLLETGINANQDVYLKMYEKTLSDLNVTAYILSHYKVSPKGVAYYVLSHKEQADLGILAQRGKDNVNLFANIKDVHVWCSISEDRDNNVWRVSIRSKKVTINDVARVFEGGGHPQASGAKLADLDQLPRLIEALEALL